MGRKIAEMSCWVGGIGCPSQRADDRPTWPPVSVLAFSLAVHTFGRSSDLQAGAYWSPLPGQSQCLMVTVVPAYRCGAVLDFHQVPFSTDRVGTDGSWNLEVNRHPCQAYCDGPAGGFSHREVGIYKRIGGRGRSRERGEVAGKGGGRDCCGIMHCRQKHACTF